MDSILSVIQKFLGIVWLLSFYGNGWPFSLFQRIEVSRKQGMIIDPKGLSYCWVVLAVKEDPLSICRGQGKPNCGIISLSITLKTPETLSVLHGNASVHPVKVSVSIGDIYNFVSVVSG